MRKQTLAQAFLGIAAECAYALALIAGGWAVCILLRWLP